MSNHERTTPDKTDPAEALFLGALGDEHLSAEELELWLNSRRFRRSLDQAIHDELDDSTELSNFEFDILVALAANDGEGVSLSSLAGHADMRLSHASRVVTRMEKRGLISRSDDPRDRRVTLLNITADGHELLASSIPGYFKVFQKLLFNHLTPEQTSDLNKLLRVLVSAANPHTSP